jgi:hypothetical protein
MNPNNGPRAGYYQRLTKILVEGLNGLLRADILWTRPRSVSTHQNLKALRVGGQLGLGKIGMCESTSDATIYSQTDTSAVMDSKRRFPNRIVEIQRQYV